MVSFVTTKCFHDFFQEKLKKVDFSALKAVFGAVFARFSYLYTLFGGCDAYLMNGANYVVRAYIYKKSTCIYKK